MKILVVYVVSLLFLSSGFLSGCAQLRKHSQVRRRLSSISTGNLKGLSKVDIIKRFGQPLARSKSEVCESWYYGRPREIWIWFDKNNKVERWESN